MRRIKIGRDPGNDVVLAEVSVSRHHAEAEELGGGRFRLKDLGSSGGTRIFHNGAWTDVLEAIVRRETRLQFGEYETTLGALVPEDPAVAEDPNKTVVRRADAPPIQRPAPAAPDAPVSKPAAAPAVSKPAPAVPAPAAPPPLPAEARPVPRPPTAEPLPRATDEPTGLASRARTKTEEGSTGRVAPAPAPAAPVAAAPVAAAPASAAPVEDRTEWTRPPVQSASRPAPRPATPPRPAAPARAANPAAGLAAMLDAGGLEKKRVTLALVAAASLLGVALLGGLLAAFLGGR
jgi:hypothetical protein